MQYKYKAIISNKDINVEVELGSEIQSVRVGTEKNCDVRLHRSQFFGSIELVFIQDNGEWTLQCSDNLYIDVGDVRKLLSKSLNHGEQFAINYAMTGSKVFFVEFVIDFDNERRRFERYIDISKSNILKIGIKPDDNIVISSEYLKNDEIQLERRKEGFVLSIINSTYGVYRNGNKAISGSLVKYGDFISISDYIFYIKSNGVWTEKRSEMKVNNLSCRDKEGGENYPKFIRNSRIKVCLDEEAIEILDPPQKPEKPKNHIITTLLPSMGMLIASLAMGYMGGTMIVFSIISGGIAIVTTVIGIVQARLDYKKSVKERKEKYSTYITNKVKEIEEFRKKERNSLEEIYINQEEEIRRIETFSDKLFERSVDDKDFLCIRLGTGDIEANKKINYKKQERIEVDEDILKLPEKVSKEYKFLRNAPVICDLKKINAVSIIGRKKDRISFLRNMILDLCTRQYYVDLEMFAIAENYNLENVEWLRFLPYFNNEELRTRNIVCDNESKNRVFDYLFKEFSQREKGQIGHNIIVIFFDEYGFQNHPISKFLPKARSLKITFVFLTDSRATTPAGCDYIIDVKDMEKGTLIDTSDKKKSTEFNYISVDVNRITRVMNILAPIYTDEISLESSLTKNISLFELLNIFTVEDLNLKKRWSESNVSNSMAVPLGVANSGVVTLDLHDKAHGPHGLVAGTTGSGKSEILQSYILSVATLFHPHEISFMIIDFKGGGMANQFRNLPHLLGTITNIDGKEINRSLKALKAELQKRQRLFAKADVNHIDKYIAKYKTGNASYALPHLVIIVDEFAELKAEQPEFMKELISAARIGRSLGVHLILATQKPSGQVDDQIWSNSRFKLCLKVQNTDDSNEVLKSPLAAEIKEPGRAYLQVGNNEIFELFQSAYSGASEKVNDSSIKEFSIAEIDRSGRKTEIFSQKKKKESENITQLEAIVNYVADYCKKAGISKLDSICMPALKELIDYPYGIVEGGKTGVIGVYDDPDNQAQDIAEIDIDNKNTFIVGSAQYGKTNILQVLIRNIASSCSSEMANIYICDFGSMVLKNFERLKHCGGVVCAQEDEKLKNLFKLILTEIVRRKSKLAEVGVSSFVAYTEAGYSDLPHIYLFIDNLSAMIELYLRDNDSLLNIVREGISVGISVIAASIQTSGFGYKYMSNFSNMIALYCNDANEYGNIFNSMSIKPDEKPGRLIYEFDKRVLECQAFLAFNGEKEIDRYGNIQQFIEHVNNRNTMYAKRIPFIPSYLDNDILKEQFEVKYGSYKVPIGLTYKDVEPFYFDMSQLGLIGFCGKEGSGHRNMVVQIVKCMLMNKEYPPNIIIFDDINRKYADLEHKVTKYIVGAQEVSEIISLWHDILEKRYDCLAAGEEIADKRTMLLIIGNNDVAKRIQGDSETLDMFKDIVERFKGLNASIIFANYPNNTISYDAPEPFKMIKQEKHLLLFDDLDNLKPFEVSYEAMRENKKRVEKGDGYYIDDNMVIKLKLVKSE